MDNLDRDLINRLQTDFPVCERPFAAIAGELGTDEDTVILRLQKLLDEVTLSRFGPLYNLEKMGGVYSLAAMSVPAEELDSVAGIVNAYPQVAHNYQRSHRFNLWFVLATASEAELSDTLADIRTHTGYPVYNMPKLNEYYIGLRLDA